MKRGIDSPVAYKSWGILDVWRTRKGREFSKDMQTRKTVDLRTSKDSFIYYNSRLLPGDYDVYFIKNE